MLFFKNQMVAIPLIILTRINKITVLKILNGVQSKKIMLMEQGLSV